MPKSPFILHPSSFIPSPILPLLQLTRMALVFTAIADSTCALFLQSQSEGHPPSPLRLLATILISVGLYGFGMSLNDIIDQRRDSLTAPTRPLPSGRIGSTTAHLTAALLALTAIAGATLYSHLSPAAGYHTLLLVLLTLLLITFYDYAGKYLVAPGLLTLGLIRFFHAAAPAPVLPLPWHPLLLLNHVTLLSLVAYHWEQKRPPLTKSHYGFIATTLLLANALVLLVVHHHRPLNPPPLLPLLVAIAFIAMALHIRRTTPTPRQAGQRLMLTGLLWLIAYDASFLLTSHQPLPALCVFLLLPLAYLSVRTMRWWSQLSALSHRPDFKRT